MNSSLVEAARSMAIGMALTLVWLGCAAVVGAVKSKSVGDDEPAKKIALPAIIMGEPQLVQVDASVRVPPKRSFYASEPSTGPVMPCGPTRPQTKEVIDEAALLVEEIHEMQVQMEVLTNEAK